MLHTNTSTTSKTTLATALVAGLLFASPVMAAGNQPDSFDANGDGQITFPEVMQKVEKSARTTFDAMDHNKDGVLSDKDFDDVREGMQKLQDWLNDLLKPFIKEDKSGPMAV